MLKKLYTVKHKKKKKKNVNSYTSPALVTTNVDIFQNNFSYAPAESIRHQPPLLAPLPLPRDDYTHAERPTDGTRRLPSRPFFSDRRCRTHDNRSTSRHGQDNGGGRTCGNGDGMTRVQRRRLSVETTKPVRKRTKTKPVSTYARRVTRTFRVGVPVKDADNPSARPTVLRSSPSAQHQSVTVTVRRNPKTRAPRSSTVVYARARPFNARPTDRPTGVTIRTEQRAHKSFTTRPTSAPSSSSSSFTRQFQPSAIQRGPPVRSLFRVYDISTRVGQRPPSSPRPSSSIVRRREIVSTLKYEFRVTTRDRAQRRRRRRHRRRRFEHSVSSPRERYVHSVLYSVTCLRVL